MVINFIELAGTEVLISKNKRLVKNAGGLYFVGVKASVYEFAAKSHFIQQIGRSYFFDSKSQAIGHIHKKLEQKTCNVGHKVEHIFS